LREHRAIQHQASPSHRTVTDEVTSLHVAPRSA
jgi:hypothetical protein